MSQVLYLANIILALTLPSRVLNGSTATNGLSGHLDLSAVPCAHNDEFFIKRWDNYYLFSDMIVSTDLHNHQQLKHKLQNGQSGFFANELEIFQRPFLRAQYGQKVIHEPNAGGNSIWSEVMSFELFGRLFNITQLKTEMQVRYNYENCPLADGTMMISDCNIGLSVTRAANWPSKDGFTDEDADNLLYKKMHGILFARNVAIKSDRWSTSLLHIWCQSIDIYHTIQSSYHRLMASPGSTNKRLIVIATICSWDYLYRNSVPLTF